MAASHRWDRRGKPKPVSLETLIGHVRRSEPAYGGARVALTNLDGLEERGPVYSDRFGIIGQAFARLVRGLDRARLVVEGLHSVRQRPTPTFRQA